MSIQEKSYLPTSTEQGNIEFSPHLKTRDTYTGISQRIKGFRRIQDAVGHIQGIEPVNPVIVLQGLYDEYTQNGLSDVVRQQSELIWKYLDGDHNPLIVRRLFPDRTGEAQDGPRSGNVANPDSLTTEIVKFFDYYSSHFNPNEVLPEIMVHRVVDAGNPPKNYEPFLPFASGDAIPIGDDTYQIRATWGADESVQGFPADTWTVNFEAGGVVTIRTEIISKKDESVIPGTNQYRRFQTPTEYQDVPSLTNIQVLTIAEASRAIKNKFGPHRIEFDGTRRDNAEILAIIEAAPFEIKKNTPEILRKFDHTLIEPIWVISSRDSLNHIQPNSTIIGHVSPEFFQGNEQREALTKLSIAAKRENSQLIVLASGNIATQHAVRVLMDHGHVVFFVKDEEFQNGERIRIYPKISSNEVVEDIGWERENPVVLSDQIKGRSIEKIGRKAHGLKELQRHGFNVPPYLVLETSLFRRFLEEIDPEKQLGTIDQNSEFDDIQQISSTLQRKILSLGEFVPNLANYLFTINGKRYAVRSSATCEDIKGSSFAGIFRTLLNVKPEKVQETIPIILASALDPNALLTAEISGLGIWEVNMAVIIQKMVEAKAAGTIFTVDSAARRNDAIRIEATKGLGEGIVDGTSKNAQSIQIEKKTGSIIGGIQKQNQILTPNHIKNLYEIGLEIENKLQNGPQDIEWAINDDDEVFILQSRPLAAIK